MTFPCDANKLLGALAGMDHNVGYLYVVMLLRIYEVGGPIKDTVDALTVRTRIRKHHVRAALSKLITSGKIIKTPDGFMNPVAKAVIENATKKPDHGIPQKTARAPVTHKKHNGVNGASLFDAKLTDIDILSSLEIDSDSRKEGRTESRSADDGWPADYGERFWSKYPRKIAKAAAMRALERVKKSGAVTWVRIDSALDAFAAWAKSKEIRFVKHPATWINGGCWDDELTPDGGGHDGGNRQSNSAGGGLARIIIAAAARRSRSADPAA